VVQNYNSCEFFPLLEPDPDPLGDATLAHEKNLNLYQVNWKSQACGKEQGSQHSEFGYDLVPVSRAYIVVAHLHHDCSGGDKRQQRRGSGVCCGGA
jgi:hypothetical protein